MIKAQEDSKLELYKDSIAALRKDSVYETQKTLFIWNFILSVGGRRDQKHGVISQVCVCHVPQVGWYQPGCFL